MLRPNPNIAGTYAVAERRRAEPESWKRRNRSFLIQAAAPIGVRPALDDQGGKPTRGKISVPGKEIHRCVVRERLVCGGSVCNCFFKELEVFARKGRERDMKANTCTPSRSHFCGYVRLRTPNASVAVACEYLHAIEVAPAPTCVTPAAAFEVLHVIAAGEQSGMAIQPPSILGRCTCPAADFDLCSWYW